MQTSGCERSAVVTWISPFLGSLNLCLEKNHSPLLCLAAVHHTLPREKQRGIYHSWWRSSIGSNVNGRCQVLTKCLLLFSAGWRVDRSIVLDTDEARNMEALGVIADSSGGRSSSLITQGMADWRDSPLHAGISAPRLDPSRDSDEVNFGAEEPNLENTELC